MSNVNAMKARENRNASRLSEGGNRSERDGQDSPDGETMPSPSDSPVLAMSSIGKVGRFGNQLMQYACLRILAQRSNARVECPEWDGQRLFGHGDPEVTSGLPPAIERWDKGESLFDHVPELIPYIEMLSGQGSVRVGREVLEQGIVNMDLWGHFQWHTKFLKPEQQYFRSLFEPVDEIKRELDEGLKRLRSRGKTIVGLHIRRADFLNLPLLGFTFSIPFAWWREWLDAIWREHQDPVLFLCSDDMPGVMKHFRDYAPVTSADLGIRPSDQWKDLDYYTDFYLLSQCDVLGVSNSTFGFVAALLNTRARLFARADWDARKRVISFDPWNSPPLLYVGGDSPRVFKRFSEALGIAFDTEGMIGWIRCLVFYPVALIKIRATRFYLGFQAQGVAGVLKSLFNRWPRSGAVNPSEKSPE